MLVFTCTFSGVCVKLTMGWCYCVRFNVCFYGYGRFCLWFSHRDCLKRVGKKRKILDGLINISIHSFGFCVSLFSLILFPFGCSLSSREFLSTDLADLGGRLLGCSNDLGALSGVSVLGFFNGAKLFYLLR